MPKDAGTDVVSETQDPQQILYKTLPDIEQVLTDKLPTLVSGRVPVDIGSATLSIDANGVEIKNDAGNPVPISASSLPLPTGAATAANQSTHNTTLSTLTNNSIGGFGAVYRTGPMASAISGANFGSIQVLADAVFTNLTATNWTGSGSESLASLSVPAGVTLFGNFTGFQLTSGRVIAYKNA